MDVQSSGTPEIFYRLSIPAEKNLLRSQPSLCDGVVIGAHILLYYEASTAEFLSSLNKPVIVDPMTYVLGRPLENMITSSGNFKRSFVKLLAAFSDSRRLIEGDRIRPVSPRDFTTGDDVIDITEAFCRDTLRVQKTVLRMDTQSPLQRLLSWAGESLQRKGVRLKLICAPYFYWEATSDPWYEVNLRLSRFAKSIETVYPVYPVLCMSKLVLMNEDEMARIVSDYSEFDGVILWVSDFEEDEEGVRLLQGLSRLVKEFAAQGKEVYNMYGGYFSMLLSKIGLRGFSESICYGENKSVDTVATGGGFPRRYYVPILKNKATEVDVRAFYSENPTFLCECQVCSEIRSLLDGGGIRLGPRYVDAFFRTLSEESAKSHFMQTRKDEADYIERSSRQELVRSLAEDYQSMEKVNARVYGKGFDPSHLRNWADAIS